MDVKKCQLRPPDSPLSNANYLKYKKRFTKFPNSLLTFIFLIHYSLGQERQGILVCFHVIFYRREWRMKYTIMLVPLLFITNDNNYLSCSCTKKKCLYLQQRLDNAGLRESSGSRPADFKLSAS